MQNFQAKQALLVLVFKAKAVYTGFKLNKTLRITFHTVKHYFSTLLPVIRRLFIKMGCMDKEQAVFKHLTLSDFKKWSTTALNAHSQV